MENRRRHPGAVQALAAAARLAAKACFPHHCVVCAAEGSVLCEDCQPKLYASLRGVFVCPGCGGPSAAGRPCGKYGCPGSELAWLVSAVPYAAAPWRRLMHLWKYQGVTEAGLIIQDAFRDFLERQIVSTSPVTTGSSVIPAEAGIQPLWSDFTPVPIAAHPWRLWQRGFNQTEALAAAVGEATGQPPTTALGKRFRWRSQVQSGTGSDARAKNVRGAFYLTQKPPERAVLVDDAVTTGSTLTAAVRALRTGGTAEVGAVTFLSARRRSGRS